MPVLGHGERGVPVGNSVRQGPRARIVPGLDTDLVVLDRDVPAEGASAIIGSGARLTVLGGRVVHRSEG